MRRFRISQFGRLSKLEIKHLRITLLKYLAALHPGFNCAHHIG
jgi:hypothetical protein